MISHGPWTIALDTYTVHTGESYVTYTRAKALFSGQVDVRLRIRRRNFFDTILENIGLGGVDHASRAVSGEPHVTVFASRHALEIGHCGENRSWR